MSSFPNCEICNQQFSLKGPAPFLLPCLHAVCKTCVKSAAGGVISCSPCQREVNLTETRLQKDVVREKQILHLTVQHHPELVLCTHDEDGNQAVGWCNECKDFLCENCQTTHDRLKITKNHTVHDVEAMDPVNLDENQYCTVHSKYIADTWDKDCSMMTCAQCSRGDHNGHNVDFVDDAAEIAKADILNFGKEVQYTVNQHAGYIKASKMDLESVSKKGMRLADDIKFTINGLKVILDQRQEELLIKLKNYTDTVTDELIKIKNTSESCHRRCQTTSDYINKSLQFSSRHNILELRPLLVEKSQDCRSSAPSEDYKSIPLPVFNTYGHERIQRSVSQFGTIATEDTAPNDQMKDNWTQTEEDVVQALEKMTQELQLVKTFKEKLIQEKVEAEREFEKEVRSLKKEVQQLQSSETKLFQEKREALKKSEEEVETLRLEIEQLKTSQGQLDKENEEATRRTREETYKLRQEVQQLKSSEAKVLREKREMERKYEDETVKLRREVQQLQSLEEKLIQEKRDAERKSEEEAEMLRLEVQQLKSSEAKVLREKREMERKYEDETDELRREEKQLQSIREELITKQRIAEELEKEVSSLKKDVQQLQSSEAKLIQEKRETEKKCEREADMLRLEVQKLQSSEAKVLKEKRAMERKYEDETVKLRREEKQLQSIREELIRRQRMAEKLTQEKRDAERKSEEEAEMLRLEIKQLKTSQEQLDKENEEATRRTREETYKLRQELQQLKSSEQDVLLETERIFAEHEEKRDELRRKEMQSIREELITKQRIAEELEKEVSSLKKEVQQLQSSEAKLIQEKREAEKKWEREAYVLRLDVQQLQSSDANPKVLQEKKAMERKYKEETDKMRRKVQQLQSSEAKVLKEKRETERKYEEETDKQRKEIKQLKTSQEQLVREREEATRKTGDETNKPRQEDESLQSTQEELNRERKMTAESDEGRLRGFQEIQKMGTAQEQLASGKEEANHGSREEAEKTKQFKETKQLRGSPNRSTGKNNDIEKCKYFKLSRKKFNAEKVHINAEGELINKSLPHPPDSDQRLKRYSGTCSNVPLPKHGSPQYFEVKSQMGIEKTLTGGSILLEIGLASEEEQDKSHYLDGLPDSYSLAVAYSVNHNSICRMVFGHGKGISCLPDTLENTPGTSASLHYGVVYDDAKRRIAFLDVNNEAIIEKIDIVDSSVALWPMFGVHSPHLANISMSLVVGSNIVMTEKKNHLIHSSLS